LRTKKKLEKPHIMLLLLAPVLILVDLLIIHYVKAIRRIILGLGIGGLSLGMILFVLRIE
jgi:hypothetical protein